MKVRYQNEEIELDDTMEKGKMELDQITRDTNDLDKIDLEDTLEITEDMLDHIISNGEDYE